MNDEVERKLFERAFGTQFLKHECTQAVADALWAGWRARVYMEESVARAKGLDTAEFAAGYLPRYSEAHS